MPVLCLVNMSILFNSTLQDQGPQHDRRRREASIACLSFLIAGDSIIESKWSIFDHSLDRVIAFVKHSSLCPYKYGR